MEKNSSPEYISGIDGLRAIAILAVMLFHFNAFPFWQGGFTGVDVFFVISGYVISKSLAHNADLKAGSYISGFYKRRLTRILPALLVMLLVTMLASTLFIPSSWLSNSIDATGLSAFFGYSNFHLVWNHENYFSPNVEFNPFLHTWSLAVEEQFYLIFPLIFFFILKSNRAQKADLKNKRRYFSPAVILFALAGASFVGSIFQSAGQSKEAYYLLPSRFWELAAGAILFQFHHQGRWVPKRKGWLNLLILLGLETVGAGFVMAQEGAFPFPWALLPILGTLLLICGTQGQEDAPAALQKILSSRGLTYIGKISYSLYLWHWPVAVLFRWTFGFESLFSKGLYVLVTFILAIISYHLIENPIRRSVFLKNQKNWVIVTGSLVAIILTSLGARGMVDSKSELSLSVTKNTFVWQSGQYENDGPNQPITEATNILGRQIFAVGDSHTAAYRTMLNIVSKELGVKVYEYEQGDCPVAGLLRPMNGPSRAHYRDSLAAIKKLVKPGDVIFLASLRMPELAEQDPDNIVAEFFSAQAIQNRKQALAEAEKVVESFTVLGATVVMEGPLPVLLSPPYRCSDWFNKMNPIGVRGLSVSRGFLQKLRQPVMESIAALTANQKNFYLWDPFPVLCTGETFSAYDQNGKPILRDGDHLSGNGNRILAPSFREFLISLWGKNAKP